jgi:hypothetical protein
MNLTESIGIDLGSADEAATRLESARELGARMVRVRFRLANRPAVDDELLQTARGVVEAARRLGLRLLGVIDSDLTVAPGGAGAFAEAAPPEIVAAWSEELSANASRLVGAVAGGVAAWELLPSPNRGMPPRIDPARWAELLARAAAVVRSADSRATVVAGALSSDEADDGVEYLQNAYRLGRDQGLWPDGKAPFDAIAIRLDVLPSGGASEDEVAAALSERTRRLWRVVENLEGTGVAESRGIMVTGVSWDSALCGDDVQARNAWTALDTLTADPVVRCVVWQQLVDGADGARGLVAGATPDPDRRRPSWRAFQDFTRYAAQIAPPPEVLAPSEEPVEPQAPENATQPVTQPMPEEAPPPEAARVPEPMPEVAAPMPEEAPPPVPTAPPPVPTAAPPVPTPPSAVPEPVSAPEPAPEPPAGGATIAFRIPDAAAVLREQGLEGQQLEAAIAAVVAKYGGYEWLPPGQYEVTLPAHGSAPPPASFTNQQLISALYRAGGGTWCVLDKTGLLLSDLAQRRDEPYAGPPIESLAGLSDEELARVRKELAAQARGA